MDQQSSIATLLARAARVEAQQRYTDSQGFVIDREQNFANYLR
jgi:hypothetical protein